MASKMATTPNHLIAYISSNMSKNGVNCFILMTNPGFLGVKKSNKTNFELIPYLGTAESKMAAYNAAISLFCP